MLLEGNFVTYGTHVTVRNSIFEHINDGHPFHASRVMFTLMENVLFRYNDWFKGTAFSPATTKSYRGSGNDIVWGSSIWRYVTVENSYSAGILPGPRSLAEYVRIENLYETCDCGGIQRNASETVDSTTPIASAISRKTIGRICSSPCRKNSFCLSTMVMATFLSVSSLSFKLRISHLASINWVLSFSSYSPLRPRAFA